MKAKWLLCAVTPLVLVGGCANLMAPKKPAAKPQTVEKGEVAVRVIETGTLQADRTVEVKSRVSGRVKRLFVEEGDTVVRGQLIAEIDPQETLLQVRQNEAQVRGASAGVERQAVEIAQRRVTAANALAKAQSNLRQVEMELRIQPELTRTTVASAKSALSAAQQGYDQLVNVTQPNAKTATDVALQDAGHSLDKARTELARQRNLLAQGYVSKRDVENAELQVQLAESRQRSAQESADRLANSQRLEREQAAERVKQARADSDRAQANTIQDPIKREQYQRALREVSDARAQLRDVQALEAARRQQLAQVDQLRSVLSDGQRQLGETKIVAPISGIVTRRSVQEGELVASLNSFSAGTTIVQIEDRSKMVVKLDVNEIDVAKLSVGTGSTVNIDAFPGEEFTGKVTKIAPASSGSTTGQTQAASSDSVVKYLVEVSLDKSTGKVKSGMSAKCTMSVLDRQGVLRLPIEFVGHDDKGDFVMLAPKDKKDAKAKGTRTEVKTGARSATYVELTSGVTEGQEVVKPDYTGPARKGMMSFGPGDE